MNKSIKTKKQVSKTLIKLLNYKPLDLITIKELTEKANISRTAFYNNFHTLEDVLKYITKTLINKSSKTNILILVMSIVMNILKI